MRIQIRVPLTVISTCFLLGVATSTWAASLGVSFIGRGSGTPASRSLPASAVAGVVPQAFWNNIQEDPATFDGTTFPLLADTGAFTDVRLTYEANDSWSSDGPTVTPNDILMKGTLKLATINYNVDALILTITNLPAGTFDVLVYFSNDGTGSHASVEVGGATTFYLDLENVFSGSFIQATATTVGAAVTANYAQFNAVPSVGGKITISARQTGPGNTSIGINGVQIVQVSGSAFPTNTQATSINAQPAATLTVEGSSASFTVGATSPSRIQWQKNGIDIPGAVNATYTTPPTALSDNGATFRAIVYNNINTNTSGSATLTVDANTPSVPTQGFLNVQRWTGLDPGFATVGDVIIEEAARPPNSTFLVAGASIPDQGIDNYGAKMSGWVKPTVSGSYYFYLASDDGSRLYLNEVAAVSGTNALPDPATAAVIAEKLSAGGFELQGGLGSSGAIPLVAGKLYGLVAYLKENTGGDNLRVAWSTNETTPVGQLKPIAPTFTYAMATGAGQSSSITTQPKPVTVQVLRPATFTAAVTTLPAGGVHGTQWLKNGTAIPGANADTYKINNAPIGDNGSLISVEFYTLDGVLTSSNVLFTVLPDTFPPVAAAGAITQTLPGGGSAVQVGVGFDEGINPASLVAGNFTLNGGVTGTFGLATNILGTYTGVLFTGVTGVVPGGSYTVTVRNIADPIGNTIATTNVPFTLGKAAWADVGVPPRPSQVIPIGTDGFDILNGGRTEWATYDEVALVYVKKTNDFDVKLQVIYAEPSSQWGRVGLQARNALNAGDPPASGVVNPEIGTNQSAYAQTHVNPNQSLAGSGVWPAGDPIQPGNANANNGHEQNTRLDTGGATSGWGSAATVPEYPNVWLRLKRVGTNITGFRSEDGVTWTDQGNVSLTAQQAEMHVGPSLSAETGNIAWIGFNVYTDPFDPVHAGLFLAQFRNFGDVSASVPPSNLTIAKVGANVVLNWTAGVLQSSPSVATPAFVDVPGATSPYSTPATGGPTFYRLRGIP